MRLLFRADNPIFQSESTHYTRSMSRWTVRERRVLIGLLVIMGLLMFTPERRLGIPVSLFVLWGFHACVALRFIVTGINTISREHTQQTWEALVLTGMSARQIFFGKWLAILKRARSWLILLVVVWFIIAAIVTVEYGGFPFRTDSRVLLPLLGIVMIPILSVLETLGCTALGIMASALTKRTAAALFAGVARFAPVALFWF